jgi:YHS domain-containing protein
MKKILLLLSVGLTLISTTLAQGYRDVRKKQFNLSKNSLAIEGYDPVSYFVENKAIEGKKALGASFEGLTYYFSSEKNKDLFKQSPAKYEPQYGGYCAYGTADEHKAPTQPDTWTIIDNKLYFNYNSRVKEMWGKNTIGFIKSADEKWPALKNN